VAGSERARGSGRGGTDEATRALADRFSARAAEYEELWAPELLPSCLELIRDLPLPGARTVLDLGCGVGTLVPHLKAAAPAAIVVGADRSEGMLALAPGDVPRALMDGSRLGFAHGAFDVVVMAFMLFYLPDPRASLRAMVGVLRPGGSIGTATWGQDETSDARRVFDEELDRHRAGADSVGSVRSDAEMDSVDAVTGLFERAGFAEPRARALWIERRPDADRVLALATRLGGDARRFETLGEEVRHRCVARAKERMRELPPEAFLERDEVILATARAP